MVLFNKRKRCDHLDRDMLFVELYVVLTKPVNKNRRWLQKKLMYVLFIYQTSICHFLCCCFFFFFSRLMFQFDQKQIMQICIIQNENSSLNADQICNKILAEFQQGVCVRLKIRLMNPCFMFSLFLLLLAISWTKIFVPISSGI